MLANPDFLLYVVHIAFWTAFGMTQMLLGARARRAEPAAPVAEESRTAPYSRALLWLHTVAFGVMYWGLGTTIIPNRVPSWFPGQRIVGTCVIAAGAALMCWARVWFTSWRFRAKLDAGHQLATGGPFRFMRHPIYMGLNLLAIGSAIWDPTPATWIAAVLMVLGSDLRGRAEEKVLADAFGTPYRDYMSHTSRFVPGVY